jgi:uncharacterized protein YecT (DUF1311 family)
MKKKFVFMFLTLASIQVFAQFPEIEKIKVEIDKIDQEFNVCTSKKENMTTHGMKECAEDYTNKMDVKLIETYQGIKQSLNENRDDPYNQEVLERLVEAQKLWVKFREANSSLAATTMIGGSGEGLMYLSNKYEMTKARVLELAEMFAIGEF